MSNLDNPTQTPASPYRVRESDGYLYFGGRFRHPEEVKQWEELLSTPTTT